MSKTKPCTIGIEYSPTTLRAVSVDHTAQKTVLRGYCEKHGDFTKQENYVQALQSLHKELGMNSKDIVAVSVTGKQTYAVQIPFRKLPEQELKKALQFEIRQTLPFDATHSILDYQWMSDTHVMVVVIGSVAFQHQVDCLRLAGFNTQKLTVLPVSLANSIWNRGIDLQPGVAQALLHFSSDTCTLVVDGVDATFYSRTIAFKGARLFPANQESNLSAMEKEGVLTQFTDELRRSLNFYEKNYESKSFGNLVLSGMYSNEPSLIQVLESRIGLPLQNTAIQISGNPTPELLADVALSLVVEK